MKTNIMGHVSNHVDGSVGIFLLFKINHWWTYPLWTMHGLLEIGHLKSSILGLQDKNGLLEIEHLKSSILGFQRQKKLGRNINNTSNKIK
jgi:hypothetical protein